MRADAPNWQAEANALPLEQAIERYQQQGYVLVTRTKSSAQLTRRQPASTGWGIAWLALALVGWLLHPAISGVAVLALLVWLIRAVSRSQEVVLLPAKDTSR